MNPINVLRMRSSTAGGGGGGGGGMPTVVGAGTAVGGNSIGNPYSPGMPGGFSSGDILFLAVEQVAGEALTTPSGWTQLTGSPFVGPSTQLRLYWLRSNGTESAPSISCSDHLAARIVGFRGCVGSGDPWDILGSPTTGTGTVTVPGFTTSVNNCLVVDFAAQGRDSSTNNFTSFSNGSLASPAISELFQNATAGGNGGGVGCWGGGFATAGLVSATTLGMSLSDSYAAIKVALKP